MKNIKKKIGELRERVKELEQNIEKISESSNNNEELIEKLNIGEIFTVNQLGFIKKNFIPKQKIKEKIEELKKQRRELGFKTYLRKEDMINDDREIVCKISVLEELLQESEDKMMQINFNGDIKDISRESRVINNDK